MRLELDADGHDDDLAHRGHHRGRQDAGRPEGRQGRDRRHRQSRQPPRPFGRRAAREPVSRRPAPHGARREGAHVVGRRLDRDAERPDQRQAGGRRGARVLRLVAALAVHGPDQPALRSDAQAPRLGARAGRPHPRARGLRGPRRSPDPLWPDLPDRDSGRPEYRPDQQPRLVQPGQQIRLHRDALPQGHRPQGDQGRRLSFGDGGGQAHDRAGQCRADQGQWLRRGDRLLAPGRRFPDGAARPRSP